MKNIIIGYTANAHHFIRNIYQAIKLTSQAEDDTELKIIAQDIETPGSAAMEALEASNRFDNILIIIEDDLLPHHFDHIITLTTYLKKPYQVIIENLNSNHQPLRKDCIRKLCNNATAVFVTQNHINDILAHHYQVDSDKIAKINYGHWPTPENGRIGSTDNNIAIFVDSDTIENLEIIIRSLPKLRKNRINTSASIFLSGVDQQSHWIHRNRILINRLNLSGIVEWHNIDDYSISHLARNYSMTIFAWSNNNGGNNTFRFETMTAGGALATLSDSFANSELNSDCALIIEPGSIDKINDLIAQWNADLVALGKIKETAKISGETKTWSAVAARINKEIAKAANKMKEADYPQFDILIMPELSVGDKQTIENRLSFTNDNIAGHALLLLNKIVRDSSHPGSFEFRKALRLIKENISNPGIDQEMLFSTVNSLLTISALNDKDKHDLVGSIIEEMAPIVQKDYHLIEFHYHLIKYRHKAFPHLLAKINERADYLADITEESLHSGEKNYLDLIKSVLTIMEGAEITGNRKHWDRAIDLLEEFDKAFFTSTGYKPSTTASPSMMMQIAYLATKCHQKLFSRNWETEYMDKMVMIWNWMYGFNEKNKIYYNSITRSCCFNSETEPDSVSNVNDTLMYWLVQKSLQSAMIESYYKTSSITRVQNIRQTSRISY